MILFNQFGYNFAREEREVPWRQAGSMIINHNAPELIWAGIIFYLSMIGRQDEQQKDFSAIVAGK